MPVPAVYVGPEIVLKSTVLPPEIVKSVPLNDKF